MKVKQLSLFLENKPGALSRPVKLLSRAKFNILTMSIADTQQFGILRFVVRDWEKAKRLLEKDGFVVKVSDMVAIEVADEPGGLADILVTLEKARRELGIYVRLHAQEGRQRRAGVPVRRPGPRHRRFAEEGISPIKSVDLFKRLEG